MSSGETSWARNVQGANWRRGDTSSYHLQSRGYPTDSRSASTWPVWLTVGRIATATDTLLYQLMGICKYYIGPSATCFCRLPQLPARNWPSMYSFFAQKMAYCHFELCRDCGLGGCFIELLLANIRKLSVVEVVFLHEITVFSTKQNSITFGTLF